MVTENAELFEKEAAILVQGERVLADPHYAGDPLRDEYARLLAAYGKLHRQSVRLVRISDRWQWKLRELNELKNRFLGIAAHDLRNPTGAIRNLSALMLEGELDADTSREFLGDICRVSNEMLTLLDDLLDVSLIESGRLQLRRGPVDLVELVRARVRILSAISQRKGIAIDTELQPLPPLAADADRLGQVIDNLISNAVKFSAAGTRVRVSLASDGDWASLSVRDQGPGIPPEEQDELFGMFHKTSVRPTGGERSTGIGLAIAKKVVDAHRGRIRLDSVVGEGSCFTVSLPLA